MFARAPVPGRCKTRLIARYGARGAAAIHRQLCLRTLRLACASGLPVELWCAPGTGHAFLLACRREFGVALHRQPHGDLGRRMSLAIGSALRRGARAAIVIGTDSGTLSSADLLAAAQALEADDAVIQPALDGGYVLIGARRALGPALRGISWSSGAELGQTLRRLERARLGCRVLAPRWDVDRPQDVRRARRAGIF